MKYFEHINVRSVDEAISQIREREGKAVFIAGGTDLLGVLKTEILPNYPEALVNIKTIPGLDDIKEAFPSVSVFPTHSLWVEIIENLCEVIYSSNGLPDYPCTHISVLS